MIITVKRVLSMTTETRSNVPSSRKRRRIHVIDCREVNMTNETECNVPSSRKRKSIDVGDSREANMSNATECNVPSPRKRRRVAVSDSTEANMSNATECNVPRPRKRRRIDVSDSTEANMIEEDWQSKYYESERERQKLEQIEIRRMQALMMRRKRVEELKQYVIKLRYQCGELNSIEDNERDRKRQEKEYEFENIQPDDDDDIGLIDFQTWEDKCKHSRFEVRKINANICDLDIKLQKVDGVLNGLEMSKQEYQMQMRQYQSTKLITRHWKLCRNGRKCQYHKRGKCWFYHPTSQINSSRF